MAIVCAVGERPADRRPARDPRAVGARGRAARMVSQAASRRNITVVLREADCRGGHGAAAPPLLRGGGRHDRARGARHGLRPEERCACSSSGTAGWAGWSRRSRPATASSSPPSSTTRGTPMAAAPRPSAAGRRRGDRLLDGRGDAREPAAAGRAGRALVIGTTGWQAREAELRDAVARHGGRGRRRRELLARREPASRRSRRRAGRLLAGGREYGALIHEAAPPGQAGRARRARRSMLRRALERGGYARPIDVSVDAGRLHPGHAHGRVRRRRRRRSRSRTRCATAPAFAHGALAAARWVVGTQGWFTMRDVLGDLDTAEEGRDARLRSRAAGRRW